MIRAKATHWIDLWIDGERDQIKYLSQATEHTFAANQGANAGIFRQRNTADKYYYGKLQHLAFYQYAIPDSSIVQRARLVSGLTVPSLAVI